eukprot:jgi/Psemu1/26646/gm1.26646_g
MRIISNQFKNSSTNELQQFWTPSAFASRDRRICDSHCPYKQYHHLNYKLCGALVKATVYFPLRHLNYEQAYCVFLTLVSKLQAMPVPV